jgi:hypothetical protein
MCLLACPCCTHNNLLNLQPAAIEWTKKPNFVCNYTLVESKQPLANYEIYPVSSCLRHAMRTSRITYLHLLTQTTSSYLQTCFCITHVTAECLFIY